METKQQVRDLIQMVNSGKAYPALDLVRPNITNAAIMSKLIEPRDQRRFNQNQEGNLQEIDHTSMRGISDEIRKRTKDSENMMQLFPDMELATQILISSIISPKDMMNTEVTYRINDSFLPSEINMFVIDRLRYHLENYYKIKEEIPDMLREMLFESGSYILCCIPENSIDELINGRGFITKESLSELVSTDDKVKSLGILGSPDPAKTVAPGSYSALSLEAFSNPSMMAGVQYDTSLFIPKDDTNSEKDDKISKLVQVTDNFNVLKLPQLISKNNKERVRRKIKRGRNIATEGAINRNLESVIYKKINTGSKQFTHIATKGSAYRKSVGRPLVMKLPSESVIPVHVPGDEKDHIGYFVLIDDQGNPVSHNSSNSIYGDLEAQLNNSSTDMSSFLMNKAKRNLTGQAVTSLTIDQATRIYSGIIENDLLARLKSGYNRNVEIARPERIYRIMLTRAFANQQTRLVYVPVELITYFAYKYHENGTGKSLVDDMRILNSIRAMTMFARVMASLKNSIGITEVKMKLDERDPDPQKSIETAITEILKTRQQYFPLGLNTPSDMADWVQRSGLEFTFEGHPKIPDMNFEFNQKGNSVVKPDEDLDEELKKRSIMAVGLSPETVDNGFASEFATTAVSNNILLSKRVSQIQKSFTPHLTDYARKVAINDIVVYDEIISIFKENRDVIIKNLDDEDKEIFESNEEEAYEMLYERLLDLLELTLPQPSTTTLESQMASFDNYVEALDKALDAWINTEQFPEGLYGEVANNIDGIRAGVRAYFIRQWMSDNNVMPELSELTTTDEEGRPKIDLFEIQKEHSTGLTRTFTKFITSLKPMKDASDKDLAATGMDTGSTGGFGGDSSSTDNTTGGDEFGFGGDGMGDLGDLGGESASETPDEPTDETPIDEPPADAETEDKNDPEKTDDKKSEIEMGNIKKDEDTGLI